ncbi:MAG: glycerol kinase GlpK [Clostridia bacterium]|nr:glycerol kinase GlpK [Clostridia bacterium]
MKKYLLALDQGTTSSRCIIFTLNGEIVTVAQKEFKQIFPYEGWVEHDPWDIFNTQLEVAQEALRNACIPVSSIAGIGITNQRETTVIWDRITGEPIYNAIVWQCRRTSEYCDSLKAQGLAETIRLKTGLLIDSYFSATKIKWILDNVAGARERAEKGELMFGTVDTWLIYNLTGGTVHATDYSNAARTLLYNINTLEWDDELLSLFGVPRSMLPEVMPSSHLFGYTETEMFGIPLPIAGVAGDQQAALFGQGCFNAGDVKNTYGTGGFMLMNTGAKPIYSEKGLLTTIAWGINGKVSYVLEGSVFVCGAAIQWLRDGLKLFEKASESEALALEVEDNGGVYVVPAFVGLGAPYWDPYARGTIIGITRGTTKNHITRAVLESMAYQTVDVLQIMIDETGAPISELKVDGGASANNLLLQFQSDVLGSSIVRPRCIETTALGAAYLAGLAMGVIESLDTIRASWQAERVFTPSINEEEKERKLKYWHKAVKCSLAWIE